MSYDKHCPLAPELPSRVLDDTPRLLSTIQDCFQNPFFLQCHSFIDSPVISGAKLQKIQVPMKNYLLNFVISFLFK